ncbi:MAG TPA: endonuclease III [Lachnospiraceae bacterium]|nr:endonuclease III [Lachnospiraceae bacterium]
MEKRVKKILELFDEYYGDKDKCYLNYSNAHELLIATILSAQCTDDRVNIVTKELFKRYVTVDDFAEAQPQELESYIRSAGFYRNKAKNIIGACRELSEKYSGVVPRDIEKLTALPGVGRKTANVVRTHIFNIPSIVVDTHVKRISQRLGLTKSEDPVKIEFELMDIFPKEHWGRYNTQAIAHGRAICKARGPKCEECMFSELCPYFLNSL